MALIQDGDMVYIDIEARTLNVDVSEEEFARRKQSWKPVVKPATGWLQAPLPQAVYLCTPRRYRLLG